MRILIAGSEMVPLVKTGGLGDVLGALPRALSYLGHDVIAVIPFYRMDIKETQDIIPLDLEGEVTIGGLSKKYTLFEFKPDGQPFKILLIDCESFFKRKGLYASVDDGKDFEDNDLRFAYFSKVVVDLVQRMKWKPDIIHAHDWQAALVPVYLRTKEKTNAFFSKTKTVLTIHNMAYQGKFKGSRFSLLELPDNLSWSMGALEYFGDSNFLKGGIVFADKITSVSKTYAGEIQGELGCGLDGVLKTRSTDILGILNGVDYDIWSPSKDKKLKFRYREANLSGKRRNKVELLKEIGFPVKEKTPLMGMVTRLVEQKGLRLVIEGSQHLFSLDLQLVILGSGDKQIEKELMKLERKFPKKLKLMLKFDERLAHIIEAGSDMFLMPSVFEPCGLNQMYSLKYGTPPIVHKVGGLADTVIDYNEESDAGTGFVFEEFTVNAMVQTIIRAIDLFGQKRKWSKLIKRGMKQDFSWHNSAKEYIKLFETALKAN